ncbi:ABC transporter ATP-binding protein [Tumebacillus sp. DT12]|uniref:ABC transporter ATP-binding protein n=1 Tax=Tumebacillus lacus TaxID=2995335 RepID=A0ABT3X7F8_9BACL|nr:ABC transporter ATP-binding protein [Tumebacillus lacus]MCX7571807.1 ABC transporter ATP-binding protein [Tumebacillus lacus]
MADRVGLAIETFGLRKEFDGDVAVDSVSLSVPEGSIFGLMGPNGAGKSTLIGMLLGMLQPTAGSGAILGRSITDPSGAVRAQVGYVTDAQHLYPYYRIAQVLELCSRVYPHWDAKRCAALMKAFGLPQQKWVWSLSKGMRTQLALVIALSVKPRVLILDEPTSGLDPVMKQAFKQLILEEAATGDTTVFFSTHHLHDLERMADHVAVMMEGRVLFSKGLDEVKENARKIQAVFPDGLPEEIRTMREVLKVEGQGRVYAITVSDHFHEVFARVKAMQPIYIESVDLGLEELFIHTVGKEGYSLELFAESVSAQ